MKKKGGNSVPSGSRTGRHAKVTKVTPKKKFLADDPMKPLSYSNTIDLKRKINNSFKEGGSSGRGRKAYFE